MPVVVLSATCLVILAGVGLATGSASIGALAGCVGTLVSVPVWGRVLGWR